MKADWKRITLRFLAAQTVSLLGSSLVQYAITWYITLTTDSGLMMMLSIVCGFLPNVFLSPFSGVWADRYNRKTLIMLADGGIAISTLVLALLFISGIKDVWLLFGVSAIRSLGAGVQMPAVNAMLPQIVPDDKLTRVNGLNTTIQSAVNLLSPILSGALLAVASIDIIFFVDVVTAAAAIVIMLVLVKVPPHDKASHKQTVGYFSDFVKGWQYIIKHPFVLRLIIFSALFTFLIGPAAFLTPLQVTRSFNGDVWHLSVIEITFSAGMILGGLTLSAWGGFKNRTHTTILSAFILSLLTVALGVVPVFWLYAIIMVLLGLAIPYLNMPVYVVLQEKVDNEYMGRVFGVLSMIASAAMPFSMIVFGPLADIISIEWLLVATGAFLLLLSGILSANKTLLKAGEPLAKVQAEQ